jgi:hypothetical protein
MYVLLVLACTHDAPFHGCGSRSYWMTDHCIPVPAAGLEPQQGPLKLATRDEICLGYSGGRIPQTPPDAISICFRAARPLDAESLKGQFVEIRFDREGRAIRVRPYDGPLPA